MTKQPSRKELITFIRRALDDLRVPPQSIKNAEELETLTVPQLRYVASIILALGYEPEAEGP